MAGTKETAVVMATHSELAAKSADRILAMRDGRLI
jgi:ABC-type lipoprotein export system ATPase subunit